MSVDRHPESPAMILEGSDLTPGGDFHRGVDEAVIIEHVEVMLGGGQRETINRFPILRPIRRSLNREADGIGLVAGNIHVNGGAVNIGVRRVKLREGTGEIVSVN